MARRRGGAQLSAPPDPDDRSTAETLRDGDVPGWLRNAAAVSWRSLVVIALAAVVVFGLVHLRVIFIPLALALLIAAVLGPPARWLMGRGWPPTLATWALSLVVLTLLVGLGWLLVPQFASGLADIGPALGDAYEEVREWLVEGPLGIDPSTIEGIEETAADRARDLIETGVTTQAGLFLEILTAFVLTLVVAFFYIKDGEMFRGVILDRFPTEVRDRAARAMDQGMTVLRRYLLGTVVVGLVDATVIGIGLVLIGVPLVVPLMAFTFLAAFFPLVGAIVAGLLATLVALAAGGAGDALLVLLLTIVVQQIDGDVVAPLVYSRAVNLHPLAILLALTAGAAIAGILGAFLAVPLMAVVVAMRKAWIAEGEASG